MLRHSHSPRRWSRLAAALSGLALLGALASSAAAQSTTPERALLNAVPAPYTVANDVAQPPVDGERALLGGSASEGFRVVAQWQEELPAVDGDRALRGILPQTTRGRLTLAR